MKLGITNLAWDLSDDLLTKSQLKNYDYFETVFPRIDYGYYSTQSIFYGSDVETFEEYYKTLNRMHYVIDECKKYDIKIIVFGSPSLRKGNKNNLLKVFNELNSKLKLLNIFLCIEPNSSYYGAEYYHTISEIIEDIKNFSNIQTMIDTHNLILEKENIFECFLNHKQYIKHIHFSEKDLTPIADYSMYQSFINFLDNNKYNYGITYELKKTKNLIIESKKFIEQMLAVI
jgi:sugar phosphate isomerase/epimerase